MKIKPPIIAIVVLLLVTSSIALDEQDDSEGAIPGDVEPSPIPGGFWACRGDANSDTVVDDEDLALIASFISGEGVPIDLRCSDVTGDGNVTLLDYTCLEDFLQKGNYAEGCSPLKQERPAFLEIRGVDTKPNPLQVGEKGELLIFIRNIGNANFKGAIMVMLTVSGKHGLENPEFTLDIPRGGEKRVSVEVPKEYLIPPGGVYGIEVAIAYWEEPDPDIVNNAFFESSMSVISSGSGSSDGLEEIKPKLKSQEYLAVIGIIAGVIAIVAIMGIYYVKKKHVARIATPMSGGELQDLYKKRDEIEGMIRIAKVKFYKRQMDEDSYKEIVTKHQEKLIEIEARIDSIEKTVRELKEDVKNAQL